MARANNGHRQGFRQSDKPRTIVLKVRLVKPAGIQFSKVLLVEWQRFIARWAEQAYDGTLREFYEDNQTRRRVRQEALKRVELAHWKLTQKRRAEE